MRNATFVMLASMCLVLLQLAVVPDRLRATDDNIFVVDVRHRPPEMNVDGETWSGPLIDIIEEAAHRITYRVKFQVRQFEGSLRYMEHGKVDILPRAICTPTRASMMDFLGPIGYEQKEIVFLVQPGQEDSIQTFDDLKHLTVGVKQGTVYFKEFDASQEIVKIESHDDENLVRMFAHHRFDAMIILDRDAVEAALKKYQISAYAYAHYKLDLRIGIYYGIRRNHPAKDALQHALEDLVTSGSVKAIYAQYGLTPPFFDIQQGFERCLQE